MADGGKKNRKIGRSKRNGQAASYRNERRREQNKLRRLRRHIKFHGVTGQDVIDAAHRCQDTLAIKRSEFVVDPMRRAA